MSNSLSGVYDAIIGPAALQALKVGLLPLSAFATDFSASALKKKGQAIDVPLFTAQTADTDQNDYEDETGSTTSEKTVTMNTYAKRTVYLTDKEAGENQIDLWKGMVEEASYSVAKLVVQTVCSAITASNYGDAAYTGAAAEFDTDDLYSIRTTLNKAGVPARNRSVVLTSDYTEGILTDSSLKNASASGSNDPLREANPGRIAGMNIVESDIIPNNSENLVGFACHQSAAAVAMRPFEPQQGWQDTGLYWRVFTDPETGISLSFRSHYSNAKGKLYATVDSWYGYAVAQANALKRVTSA